MVWDGKQTLPDQLKRVSPVADEFKHDRHSFLGVAEPKLAAEFGIEAAPYPGRPTPLEPQLADAGPTWAKIAARHALAEADLGKLASAWHTDLDLGPVFRSIAVSTLEHTEAWFVHKADRSTRGEKHMVAANLNYRFSPDDSDPVLPVFRPGERLRHYFDQDPALIRPEFFPAAALGDVRYHEQREPGIGPALPPSEENCRSSSARPALTARDFRIHAWLTQRMAALHYERHGLWPRLRRFLFGDRNRIWS
jgi:hypothetical protein